MTKAQKERLRKRQKKEQLEQAQALEKGTEKGETAEVESKLIGKDEAEEEKA